MISDQDREEFSDYCRSIEVWQLENVVDKEKDAGRAEYAAIAIEVLRRRA